MIPIEVGVGNTGQTVSSMLNQWEDTASNAGQALSDYTGATLSQLGDLLNGVNNGIGASISGIGASFYTPSMTNYAQPSTQNYAQGSQFEAPSPSIGLGLATTEQARSGINYIPQNALGASIAANMNNYTQNQYDINALQNAMSSALSGIAGMLNGVGTADTNPLLATLAAALNNYEQKQQEQIDLTNHLVQDMDSILQNLTVNMNNRVQSDTADMSNYVQNAVTEAVNSVSNMANRSEQSLFDTINQSYAKQSDILSQQEASLGTFTEQISNLTAEQTATVTKLEGLVHPPTSGISSDVTDNIITAAMTAFQAALKGVIDSELAPSYNFLSAVSERIDEISTIISDMEKGKYTSTDEFYNAIFGSQSVSGFARGITILISLIPTLIQALNMAGAPALQAFGYLVTETNPTQILGIQEVIELIHRGILTTEKATPILKKHGLSDENIYLLLQSVDKFPDINTLTQMVWRGKLSTASFNELIGKLGLISGSEDYYSELLNVIPGPSDLTRIADKRVWSQQTASKYGQYSEVPQEYHDFMAKWGYDKQFVDWLWAAHWQLPSPNEVFEMQHRGLLQPGDIETYLGLTDWLPYFRDKLLDITYNVLTRVDVRRLYKQGILTDTELHKQHLKMGYTEEDASRLDAYVRQTNLPEDETEYTALEKRTRSAVEKGYSTGRIDRTEALQMLKQLGVSDALANQSLALLDFELSINNVEPTQKSLQQNAINVIRAAYKKGNISRQDAHDYLLSTGYGENEANLELTYLDLDNTIRLKSLSQDSTQKLFSLYEITDVEFHNRLNALGFSARETEIAYQEALIMRDNRTKKLTYAQLQKLFKKGIITSDQYANELKGLGYTDQSVYWLISEDILPDSGVQ